MFKVIVDVVGLISAMFGSLAQECRGEEYILTDVTKTTCSTGKIISQMERKKRTATRKERKWTQDKGKSKNRPSANTFLSGSQWRVFCWLKGK